jgi:hypothetical protein
MLIKKLDLLYQESSLGLSVHDLVPLQTTFPHRALNPLAYTAACEAVWTTDVFAFSSSFLSVDGRHVIYRFKAEKKSIFRMVYQHFDCIDF